jgi:excisionase family DNA binding protein
MAADPTQALTLQLPDELLDEIARRTATLVLSQLEVTGEPSPYLTIPQAAAYLRCKRQRIDDLLSSRRLTRYKDGRRTLILRAELDAYLAATTGPQAGPRRDSIWPGNRVTVTSPGNR